MLNNEGYQYKQDWNNMVTRTQNSHRERIQQIEFSHESQSKKFIVIKIKYQKKYICKCLEAIVLTREGIKSILKKGISWGCEQLGT